MLIRAIISTVLLIFVNGCTDNYNIPENSTGLLKERIGREGIIEVDGALFNDTIRFFYDENERISSIIRANNRVEVYNFIYEVDYLKCIKQGADTYRSFSYKDGLLDTIHINNYLLVGRHFINYITDFKFENDRLTSFSRYYVRNDTPTIINHQLDYDLKGNIVNWKMIEQRPFSYPQIIELSTTKFKYDNKRSPLNDYVIGLAFFEYELNTFSFEFFNKNNLTRFESNDHFQHWGDYEIEYSENKPKIIWNKGYREGDRYGEINQLIKYIYYSK